MDKEKDPKTQQTRTDVFPRGQTVGGPPDHVREQHISNNQRKEEHALSVEQRKALCTPEVVSALRVAVEALAAPAPNDADTERHRVATECLNALLAKIGPEGSTV